MVNRRDYTSEAIEAAHSVLIELMHLLGEYRNEIVLVGGWVPSILFSGQKEQHVGTMDIDLAIDHRRIPEEVYKTIQELLSSRGYTQGKQPYIFHRTIKVKDRDIKVEVDLISGDYEGTGNSHRHQKIQEETRARKTPGCNLAFEMFKEVTINGALPGGGKDSVTIHVASIVPFLVMKGIALDNRMKEKDAYDIYYCIKNYPDGLDALVGEFKPYINRGLVQEGLKKIAKHFDSIDHAGPKFIVVFEGLDDQATQELTKRDAFERIHAFLEKLGIIDEKYIAETILKREANKGNLSPNI